MSLLIALALTVVVIFSGTSLALSWVGRRDVRKLLAAFERTHHDGGYPGATAVGTEGREPSPVPVSGRVPVGALPSVARSGVSVGGGEDPSHRGAAGAAALPTERACERKERDESRRNRLRLVASEERGGVREVGGETEGQTEREVEVVEAELEESEMARIDALAAKMGLTRDEMVDRAARRGIGVIEDELDK